jgi:23S rRNA (cytidine1920-2'-O)/16S rRNA (cytidine1409-2'-O)-methyltransferase
LPQDARAFDVVTMDLSFISLRQVLPAIVPLLAPRADLVALVKPQFEAGREEVGKGGLVRDPAVHARVMDDVTGAADALGLTRVAATDSPIAGAEGNREFFLHLRRTSDLPPSPERAKNEPRAKADEASRPPSSGLRPPASD